MTDWSWMVLVAGYPSWLYWPQVTPIKSDQQALLPVDGLAASDSEGAAAILVLRCSKVVDQRVLAALVPRVLPQFKRLDTHTHTQTDRAENAVKEWTAWTRRTEVMEVGRNLQVHLLQTDEHPGDESLPETCWNEAHLDQTLQRVAAPPAEAVDVHGGLVGEKVR